MKREILKYFFIGLMAAFTASMLLLSIVMEIVYNNGMIPVALIWQAFALSILCSFINLVYRSEKLKFIWQSIIGYILTTAAIITCGLIFHWYSGNSYETTRFIFISFLLYSLIYLVSSMIAWKIANTKKKELNDRLRAYKKNQ